MNVFEFGGSSYYYSIVIIIYDDDLSVNRNMVIPVSVARGHHAIFCERGPRSASGIYLKLSY